MKRNFYFSRNKGFTLIELLVVISIIGLLSTVTLASLNTTRIKARDSQRIAGLRQIQNAIELYADEHGGTYPGYISDSENIYTRSPANASEYSGVNGCGYGAAGAPGSSDANYAGGVWCRFETALSPYIKSLPRTQLLNNSYYYYTYKVPSVASGIKNYGLSVKLESANSISQNDGGYYGNYFELGPLPAYCKNKYSGGLDRWDDWSGYPCWGDDPHSADIP